MKHNFKLLIFVLSLMVTTNIYSQSAQLFGFYQAGLTYQPGKIKVSTTLPNGAEYVVRDKEYEYLTSNMQQLNLMFSSEFSAKASSFVSVELLNNFSTEDDWGAISLEEIWVKYSFKNYLVIKGGSFIPKFNYLNEIKNKMPLIPYVIRPIIYEPTAKKIIDPTDYLPQRAFLQVEGSFFTKNLELNYALFSGPAEKNYMPDNSDYLVQSGGAFPGTDTTMFLTFGGRFGLDYQGIRLGASFTSDKKNMNNLINEDVPRTRLGFDFGFNMYNFFIEAEYINVNLEPKADLKLDKSFYYVTLGYNFRSDLYGYLSLSHVKDEQHGNRAEPGNNLFMAGLGYNALDNVVLKLQYFNFQTGDGDYHIRIPSSPQAIPGKLDAKINFVSASVAVLF